jgi:lipid A 3-O-deacylase
LRVQVFIALVLACASVNATSAFGQTREPWTITLMLENDSFFLIDDRHYTNGLYASATSGAKAECGFCRAISRVTMLPSGEGSKTYRYGFFLGQTMFTPEDLSLSIPDPSDRPYAGWLHVGARAFRQSGDMLDKFEVAVGLVGHGSGADAVQRLWHALHWFGGVPPEGWHAQIKEEPGIVITDQRIWRKTIIDGPVEVEILPQAKVSLGNVMTAAAAGVTFRFGGNLKSDWGPPRIAAALDGSDFVDFATAGGFAWYFFAGVEGRAVARNIFLDGNTLQHSASVAKLPFVADFSVGAAAIIASKIRASVSYTERSREFRAQRRSDNFLSLAVSYSY